GQGGGRQRPVEDEEGRAGRSHPRRQLITPARAGPRAGRSPLPAAARGRDLHPMAAIARWAALPAGASLAYIVGHDGSPAWRVFRVAVVAALAALLWWSTRLPSDR